MSVRSSAPLFAGILCRFVLGELSLDAAKKKKREVCYGVLKVTKKTHKNTKLVSTIYDQV